MPTEYTVTVQRMQPRPIAAVRARLPISEVPRRFAHYLDQIYAAARDGAIETDGQNIFVYSGFANGQADVDFAVGVKRPFEKVGAVEYRQTPAGEAATTTHWGDYSALGAAHSAVTQWCRSHNQVLAGPSWEVYGHWSDDPTKRRTDIYYLLKG